MREFCRLAIHYQIAGRFALAAGMDSVIGNLFHHAIECGLKAFLVRKYDLRTLARRPFRHDLPTIWQEFKKEIAVGSELDMFDDAINQLNKFEELRYPDSIVAGGAEIRISFSPDASPLSSGLPQYQLCVKHLDVLMGKILEAIKVNPQFFLAGLNPTASKYLRYFEAPLWAPALQPQVQPSKRQFGLCRFLKNLFGFDESQEPLDYGHRLGPCGRVR